MDEWAANPQWWLSNTVSIILALVLPHAFRGVRLRIQTALSRAQGWLRPLYRAARYKRLRKVKAIRFDSVAINREVALSYALLILFLTTGIASFAGIFNIPANVQKNYQMTFLLGIAMASPALLFEFAWLRASSRVDDALKYRKRIKRTSRGLY